MGVNNAVVGGGAWGEASRRSPIQIILTWGIDRSSQRLSALA